MKARFLLWSVLAAAFFLNACSSAPAKKDSLALTAEDSLAIAMAVASQTKESEPEEVKLPENIDAAHEAFLRGQDADLRGDNALATEYWKMAASFDPYNRYLGFKLAEKMVADGQDSLALLQARWAHSQKGRITASQLGLLARLYVREGLVDSCRKYFTMALDSSRYQDTGLMYDYSLFLEAIKDHKELVRVYDLLLPHVNYMPSLFQRQVALLVDQRNDSAIVDLFFKAHEATGDKRQLSQLVEMLIYQQRISEVRGIVDTLTGMTTYDDNMVVNLVQYYSKNSQDSAYALLKKKFYEDGIQTPMVSNFLGHYEHMNGNRDSAKVHLEMGLQQKEGPKNFLVGAYQSLASIAVAEERYDDAVKYAETLDSLTEGGQLGLLGLTYGLAQQYQRAYTRFDSLIVYWDNWKPLENVADSISVSKMIAKANVQRFGARFWYARLLGSEAYMLEHEGPFTKVTEEKAKAMREKADAFFVDVLNSGINFENLIYYYASNLERMKRFDEAFTLFEKIISEGGQKGFELMSTMNHYGYCLVELNRTPEELARGYEMISRALEMDPTNEAIIDSKAWALYRQGKFQEALDLMLTLKDPDLQKDIVYWEHLAAIQAALGKKADANRSYKRLLKIYPNHPEALRFLKKKK